MKQAPYLLFLAFLINACGPTRVVESGAPPPPPPAPVEAPAPEVSYQSFYDEMSPYGSWVDYPGYGYVWRPNVGYGFQPYATNGHWVATDMGWAWSSNYPWGWAAFHYGRWFYDNGAGWMWIPGQEWAPAWVSWRTSTDYYGWAPLGPNMGYNTGYYNPPANYWCFVPHQYVASPYINNYYVNNSRNVTIINNTTVINNYNVSTNVRSSYRGGPAAEEVARYSGNSVRPVVVRENNRPGEQINNNQFAIYRPRVSSTPNQNMVSGRQERAVPSRVESLRDARPTARPSTPVNEPAYNNTQPVNPGRNNTAAPVTNPNPGYNNNPAGNRPTNDPSRAVRPENTGNYDRSTDARPAPANTNARPSNNVQPQPATQNNATQNRPAPATQHNASLNRPSPANPNTAKPATNSNSNQQRVNTQSQNNPQHTINRPQPASQHEQRSTTPATNQTQKPQPKPRESSEARPAEQRG